MRSKIRIGALISAASAFAVVAPAAAHPGNPNHPTHPNHPSGPSQLSQSHRCSAHNVAYIESGTVDSGTVSTLAANADGSWSGTLVLDVTQTNHWAKADKGTTVTYTFTNAKLTVRLDGGATGFTAGERVTLLGKLATTSKHCTTQTPAPAPVFRAAVVHPAGA